MRVFLLVLLFTIGGMTGQDCDCQKLSLAAEVAQNEVEKSERDGSTMDFVYTWVELLGI